MLCHNANVRLDEYGLVLQNIMQHGNGGIHEPPVVNFGMEDREGCVCVPFVCSKHAASIAIRVENHLHCRYIPHDVDGNNCQHLLPNGRFLVSLNPSDDNLKDMNWKTFKSCRRAS